MGYALAQKVRLSQMSKKLEPLRLSDDEINELHTLYKQERDRRIAERIHCVFLYAQGYDLKEIKQILLVGIRTLKKWIRAFVTQGGVDGLRRWGYEGQSCQLVDEQWAEVEEELAHKPYRRARDVAAFVKERFGIEYTERGMQALLRRKGYRYIKTRLVPGKVDADKQQEQREFIEGYFKLQAELGPKDRLYHVDAVHPTHNVKISYAWTKKGLRMRIRSNSGRKRYNILGAYCPSDHEYIDVRTITENVNGETLKMLIDEIRARHPEASRIILILDNARYNHAKIVRQYIENTTVELLFLPSYSPNLNLIERLWRFLKDKVMTIYHETFEEFVDEVDKVLDNLDEYANELASLMTEKFEILACA
jgi:transposase